MYLLFSAGRIAATRFDILEILELIEFLFLIQVARLLTTRGLLILIEDSELFYPILAKEGELTINYIALFAIVVIDSYSDKIVLNPMLEIQMKGID